MHRGAGQRQPSSTTSTSSAGFKRRTTLDRSDGHDARVTAAVEAAKGGDRDALRYLYIEYADNVFGYIRSIVRDDYEAEDVTQQVFAKLVTALPKYEQREVPFSAWILRVSRNLALDHMRQRRMIPCEEVRGVDEQFDQTAYDRATSLRQALDTLPEEQREVLILRHIVGLSPGEIAKSLGKSEGSIHGLHHRGRRVLRDALSDLECAPAVCTSGS